MPPRTRSGFAALIGRPNVGKSTLLNRLTGEKLAIVSAKPQTTRNRILGVVTRPQGQVAVLDTPGIHEAKGPLNRLMVDTALKASEEVDLNLFLISASDSRRGSGAVTDLTPENAYILQRLLQSNKPTFLVVNKVDQIAKQMLLPLIDRYRQEFSFAEILPISARTGEGVDALLSLSLGVMPEGELLYPPDVLTDQAERTLVAEYVREQILIHCREEIPYSTAVVVEYFDESDRFDESKPGLVRIDGSIFVERDSQKAIIIGKQGQMLKTIGSEARAGIERLLGCRVYLSLRVRVEPRWSERPEALRKLGYTPG